jgi:hypothetical protein
MTFTCSLECPSEGSIGDLPVPSSKDLDYESLVMEACSLLSETDCRFFMGGFGDDDWGLSVAYDLSVVIEQLPQLLTGLREGEEVELDLYSQGIERTLVFLPETSVVTIRCLSRTTWTPNPENEASSLTELESMFVRLAHDFAMSLELLAPGIASAPPFPNWRMGRA